MAHAEKKPAVSRELLDYLSRAFPDRCPSEGDTLEQVWMAAGAAKVTRNLKMLYDNQNPLET